MLMQLLPVNRGPSALWSIKLLSSMQLKPIRMAIRLSIFLSSLGASLLQDTLYTSLLLHHHHHHQHYAQNLVCTLCDGKDEERKERKGVPVTTGQLDQKMAHFRFNFPALCTVCVRLSDWQCSYSSQMVGKSARVSRSILLREGKYKSHIVSLLLLSIRTE